MLKQIPQNQQDLCGKWSPNWEGSYVVKKAFSGGVLILAEMDGKEFSNPINADIVKKYYAWGNQEKWLAKVENLKGRLWQVKQKQKKKRKRKRKMFKVKTRKGSLNHKKWWKRKKNSKGQVENPKRTAWLQMGYLDWKPEKGDLNHKKKDQIKNLKRRLDQEKRFLDWKPERAI